MIVGDEEYQVFLVPAQKDKDIMEVVDKDIAYMQLMLELIALTTNTPPFELQARFNGGMLVWTQEDKTWNWQ